MGELIGIAESCWKRREIGGDREVEQPGSAGKEQMYGVLCWAKGTNVA